jgi:hypothetical protein
VRCDVPHTSPTFGGLSQIFAVHMPHVCLPIVLTFCRTTPRHHTTELADSRTLVAGRTWLLDIAYYLLTEIVHRRYAACTRGSCAPTLQACAYHLDTRRRRNNSHTRSSVQNYSDCRHSRSTGTTNIVVQWGQSSNASTRHHIDVHFHS